MVAIVTATFGPNSVMILMKSKGVRMCGSNGIGKPVGLPHGLCFGAQSLIFGCLNCFISIILGLGGCCSCLPVPMKNLSKSNKSLGNRCNCRLLNVNTNVALNQVYLLHSNLLPQLYCTWKQNSEEAWYWKDEDRGWHLLQWSPIPQSRGQEHWLFRLFSFWR